MLLKHIAPEHAMHTILILLIILTQSMKMSDLEQQPDSDAMNPRQTDNQLTGASQFSRRDFETLLSVPPEVQDELFVWKGEFELCDRVSRIGMALDSLTKSYTTLLAHMMRTVDIRSKLIDAPSRRMVAPAYYCDRALDSTLRAIGAQRINLKKLIELASTELQKCTALRSSTERSFREAERDMPDNHQRIMRWKNRLSTLREMENRLKTVIFGTPTLFSALEKPWTEIVKLPNAIAEKLVQKDNSNLASKVRDVDHHDKANKDDKNNVNMKNNSRINYSPAANRSKIHILPQECTPTPKPRPLDQEQHENQDVAKGSKNNSQDSGVPETPVGSNSGGGGGGGEGEGEGGLVPPTQVSSPRKRKRARVAPVHDTRVARSLHRGTGSPAHFSLQAYCEIANPPSQHQGKQQQLDPVHRSQSLSQSQSGSHSRSDHREQDGDNASGSDKDKVVPGTPQLDHHHHHHHHVRENIAEEGEGNDNASGCGSGQGSVVKVKTQRRCDDDTSGSGSDKIVPRSPTKDKTKINDDHREGHRCDIGGDGQNVDNAANDRGREPARKGSEDR